MFEFWLATENLPFAGAGFLVAKPKPRKPAKWSAEDAENFEQEGTG